MKIYYDYARQELLTEQEAKRYIEQETYSIWEFIMDHYFYNEIIEKLPPDFIEEIIKTITEKLLNNEEFFLVREIPD